MRPEEKGRKGEGRGPLGSLLGGKKAALNPSNRKGIPDGTFEGAGFEKSRARVVVVAAVGFACRNTKDQQQPPSN